jgi:HD-like signal output (HDOD) protein
MSSLTLDTLFSPPTHLPVIPRVVQELIRSLGRDDVAADTVADQLAADPVLGAKTLRLANSAYFNVSRTIDAIGDAVQLLGFDMVRSLAMGCSLGTAFRGVPGVDLPAFWRHSLRTACTARWLADRCGQTGETAFTLGLIQGLGHLLMHSAQAELLASLDADVPLLAPERARHERTLLGWHHGDVGAELARRWNFPDALCEALAPIAEAADPTTSVATTSPLVALVAVGAWRSRCDHFGWAAAERAERCPLDRARAAGLPLVWLDETATLGVSLGADVTPLPEPDTLGAGLAAMFD